MVKKESILFGLVIVLCLFFVSTSFAEVVGTVSFVDGRVDILQSGQDRAVPVETGAPLSPGDILRTKSNARVEITFNDNTVVRLAQETRIEITDYLLDDAGKRKNGAITLFRGKIRALPSATEAAARGLSDFEVLTANGRADAMGSDFYFIYEKGSTWIYGTGGDIWALSKKDPGQLLFDEAFYVERGNCVQLASGVPFQGSCFYNEIDVDKHMWDTATIEKVPVVAKLKSGEEEGEVFTYTPLGGRAIETPSLPVTVAVGDLACPQCPHEGVPLEEVVEEQPTVKSGYFERIDRSDTVPSPIPTEYYYYE